MKYASFFSAVERLNKKQILFILWYLASFLSLNDRCSETYCNLWPVIGDWWSTNHNKICKSEGLPLLSLNTPLHIKLQSSGGFTLHTPLMVTQRRKISPCPTFGPLWRQIVGGRNKWSRRSDTSCGILAVAYRSRLNIKWRTGGGGNKKSAGASDKSGSLTSDNHQFEIGLICDLSVVFMNKSFALRIAFNPLISAPLRKNYFL